MTTIRESECVAIKRRGAEYVTRLLAGMSREEQLAFWRERTEAMRKRQQQAQKQSARR